MSKRITGIEIINPGSNPDVDSDFNTVYRDKTLEYVTNLYGKDNVSNIVTFGTLAAKGAFKAMCTIYDIPFARANKIANLVPPPIEGVECTLSDIFEKTSDRYSEGADFRAATEGDEWKKIIDGARAIEGRNRSTGVHPCFPAGALVKTSEGFKNIEDVRVGDSVLTHLNQYRNVAKVFHNHSDNIYLLRAANSVPTEITGNHPLYVRSIIHDARTSEHPSTRRLSKPFWKNAEDIIPNEDVIGVPVNTESKVPDGDLYLDGVFSTKGSVYNQVLDLPVDSLKELLNGTLSANGMFSTVDKEVALRVVSLINKAYGVPCEVEERDTWFRYEVRWGDKAESHSFFEDGYIWAAVSSIEKLDKDADTYNLSVVDDNSYTVNNLAVHNCGILISAKPLNDIIPMQMRQNDGRVITQWTYQECESLGLIKMDFLGLDTVDLIQHTVEYIKKNGKTAPNMLDLIHGPMDDPKVYELFQKGETIGIFQFGSEMVRNLLLSMKPTEFNDLSACTAVARPGPMGMKSHIKYADRKNGREKIDYVHPEFIGSPLEDILKSTYGLPVYQEQVMSISNQIAGFTLAQGDKLRKAMGKKKLDVMLSMKEKFFKGSKKNGYSEEAITVLWNTIEEFSKYGFNKSHSVAYAINAYQAAYLKVHFPAEFMASIIAQNIDDRKKTIVYLREAKRMGVKVGAVDINLSDVKVAPDYSRKSQYEVLFGISGVKEISETTAQEIVDERSEKGAFKSVKDLIDRCAARGITNRKVFENLALAGAFDSMEDNRNAVLTSVKDMMGDAKKKNSMGDSLFDMFDIEENDEDAIDESVEDFSYTERLKNEADMLGLYLSSHPLDRIQRGVGGTTTIEKLMKLKKKTSGKIIASVVDFKKKQKKNGKSVMVELDDGTGFMNARLTQEVIAGMDKYDAQEQVKRLFENGANMVPDETKRRAVDTKHTAIPSLEKNSVYVMDITFNPGFEDNPYSASISSVRLMTFSKNGTLPLRIRFKFNDENLDKVRRLYRSIPWNLAKKAPGDHDLFVAFYNEDDLHKPSERDVLCLAALREMNEDKRNGIDRAAGDTGESDVLGKSRMIQVRKTTAKKKVREWPPKDVSNIHIHEGSSDISDSIDGLEYTPTDVKVDINQQVFEFIERYLGYEAYDLGIFDKSDD